VVEKKVTCHLIAILLAFSMLCSMTFIATANADISDSEDKPSLGVRGFVDPVTLKIEEFKAKGMNDAQITEELDKLDMGWYPETGAVWMKEEQPTDEELKSLLPLPEPFVSSGIDSTQANEVFGIGNPQGDEYTGMYNSMYAGTLPIDEDETVQHVVTTHLGRAIDENTPCWTEVGVVAWTGSESVWYFVYDNDEGTWHWFGTKSNLQSADTYGILLNGTSDDDGWHYNIWINQVWKFGGHLAFELNNGNVANEIWSDTEVWSVDSGCGFTGNYVADDGYSWINWGSSLGYTPIHFHPTMWCSVTETSGRYNFYSGTD